jgi:calcineurin-like phosphoesterase family protein
MIWITSDWHFCHDKEFCWGKRGFSSVDEMNEEIIKRHNKVVAADDEVFCLGDCVLNDLEKGLNCMRQLNGKIHIIRGNHDSAIKCLGYVKLPNVVDVQDGRYLRTGHHMLFLSHYPCICGNADEKFFSQKVISLCGHAHATDPFLQWTKDNLIYHCEVDAHNCEPIDLETIMEANRVKFLT